MPTTQLQQSLRLNRPFKMQMQLDLRQLSQPINHIDLRILSRLFPRHLSILGFRNVELTTPAAVENVNRQSDDQPDKEPHPRNRRKTGHQQDTEEHRQNRND